LTPTDAGRSKCQRQVKVAIVAAVKEAPFLMPVQRVGGIEIEDDLLRRVLMRFSDAERPRSCAKYRV